MKNLEEMNEIVRGVLREATEMAGFTYTYTPIGDRVYVKGPGITLMRISFIAEPRPHGDFMREHIQCCLMAVSLTMTMSKLAPEELATLAPIEAAIKNCNALCASEEVYIELGDDDDDNYIGSDSPF